MYSDIIKEIFESDLTSYYIAKSIGAPTQTIDRYKNGSKVENMKLYLAEKLIKFWENEKKNKPTS